MGRYETYFCSYLILYVCLHLSARIPTHAIQIKFDSIGGSHGTHNFEVDIYARKRILTWYCGFIICILARQDSHQIKTH